MKNYYELLTLAPNAPAEEIKRAFRREIARYHPDKVQHLGPEFQEIAATRAAELTEAYRILMDEGQRQRYDESLAAGTATAAPAAEPVRRDQPPPDVHRPAAPRAEPAEPPAAGRRSPQDQWATDFVRKATLAKLREAVAAVTDGKETQMGRGIDVAFELKARGGIFRKAEPAVRLIARIVPKVDASAIAAIWPVAVGAGGANEIVCVLLLGSGLAPARDLAVAVSEQRLKSRKAGPVLVPVDVRDWEALFPPEAPASVRAIVQRLREGKN